MMILLNKDLESKTVHLLQDKTHVADDIGAQAFLEFVQGLSLLFAIVTVSMILFLVVNRKIQIAKKKQRNILRVRYQEYLADFISIPLQDELSELGVSKAIIGLSKEDISKKANRSILLSELYSLHQQLDGYQAEMLKHLFWGWYMHEDAIADLNHRSPNRVTRSIDLISEFEIPNQLEKLNELVTSKHIDVRSQAMASLVRLTSGNLDFLKNIDTSLTDWERHKVLSTLSQVDERMTINFDKLKAEIPTHSEFIEELRCEINPQFEFYTQLIEETVIR